MLEFINALDLCLEGWQKTEKWPFSRLSEETGKRVDYIVDIVSSVLNNEYDVTASLTREEASKTLIILKERMKPQLLAQKREFQARRDKALRAYNITMEKIRVHSQNRKWHSAYRTLTNFIGTYEKDLPTETILTLLNDALRVAIHAEENLQELSRWLRKAVKINIDLASKESIEEAIDFIDAYSDKLKTDPSGNGLKLLQSISESLQVPAAQFDLVNEYTSLIKDLGMIDSW